MKNVVILGSTGSIGRSTLEVLRGIEGDYRVYGLAAKSQIERLLKQVVEFSPQRLGVADDTTETAVRRRLGSHDIDVLSGENALVQLAQDDEVDIIVNALVGAVGLRATLAGLEAGKIVALANKESIVMAGPLVMRSVAESEGILIPIDSEHSAVLQCLRGESPSQVKQLILTASGGPFLHRKAETLDRVTPDEALQHPNWSMGPKITVDSATLMNKGMEVIEAHYLFNIPPEKIQVVVHPQSVVHSLVEFVDGSIKAQLSQPDMRIPIQYSLTYPDRLPADFVSTDLTHIETLTFEKPDLHRFPCLQLGYQALKMGNGYPTVLNAANEIAVVSFMEGKLSFDRIPELIEAALNAFRPPEVFNLESILKIDQWAREWCREQLKSKSAN